MRDFLARKNFDPLEELLALYRHEETDHATKVKIATELMTYCAPKLKSVDVQGEITQQSITVVLGVTPKAVDIVTSKREKCLLEPRNGSSILELSDAEEFD